MRSFKIIRAKKDITPILATLLLIAVAIATVAVTCDWIVTHPGITASEEGKQIHMSNVDFVDSPSMRIGVSADLQIGLGLWQ